MRISVKCALVLLAFSALHGKKPEALCYTNEGLKEKQTIRFEVANNVIKKGKFVRESYEEEAPKTSAFTGSKTGTVLVIEFKGKPPYSTPPKSGTIVWKIGKKGLLVPMYGKNYETNKWSAYDAVFAACTP